MTFKVHKLYKAKDDLEKVTDELWDELFLIFGEHVDTPFDDIDYDYYDNSLELIAMRNNKYLTREQFEKILELGFSQVFVQYKNGWDAHYTPNHPTGYLRGVVHSKRAEILSRVWHASQDYSQEHMAESELIRKALDLKILPEMPEFGECWQLLREDDIPL